jgi:hypothetical protein
MNVPSPPIANHQSSIALLCATAHLRTIGNHLWQVWETHRKSKSKNQK